jgi:hypothetical protein
LGVADAVWPARSQSKERLLEAVEAPARKSGRTKAALARWHDYAVRVVLGCTPLVGIEDIKVRLGKAVQIILDAFGPLKLSLLGG